MKAFRSIVAVVAAALTLTFCASAAGVTVGNITLDVPDGYITITQLNASKHADEAKLLGLTAAGLKSYMRERGIVLLAVTGNNSRQIQLRTVAGDSESFAVKVGDFSSLQDEAVAGAAEKLVSAFADGETGEYRIVTNSRGIKFIELSFRYEKVSSVQYITVRNGEMISLVCYDEGGDAGESFGGIYESVFIPKDKTGFSVNDGAQIITAAIILILIIGIIVGAVLVVISIVRDIRERDNDVRKYVRIKRRKF